MLLALNPSPSAFSPDRHGPASVPPNHSHNSSTSQQQQGSSSQSQLPPLSPPPSTSLTGKEWRISVGLTNDVHFVPAKNASVLGAGIDGKYKPISDSDMEVSDSDSDNTAKPLQLNGKGKAKATDEDMEMDAPNTPLTSNSSLSAPVTSPSGGAPGSSIATNATVVTSEPPRIRLRPIPTHWPPGLKLGRGLFNSGNTCFINSVLQSLLYTRPLLHILRHHVECPITGYCVVCELKKVADTNFHSNQRGYFNPKNISQKLPLIAKGMRLGRQEDAHEFLRYIIDACQKAALDRFKPKDRPKRAEESWVHRIFGGKTRSRVSCKRCGHNSDTFETCLDLSLDLAQGITTVEEALAAFVRPERLGGKGEDRYKCEKCKIPVDAEKQFTIEAAPQVLTVHLKRFTGTGRKIGRAIGYPTSFDLAPYVSDGTEPLMYSLYGIIAHSGSGPHSGHYFAHIKSPNDRWHEMNDEEISPGTDSPPLHMREAYILFYIQAPSNKRVSMKPQEAIDKIFGSAGIAAASAREQEKMSVTQKALSIKINQAETMKKAGAASPVTSTVTAVAVSANSRATSASGSANRPGNDDEDLGVKVEAPAEASAAPKFIGPQLPPGRNPPLQASGPSVTSVLADSVDKMNLLSPINSRSFYGGSESNPKKRASSPAMDDGGEEPVARKKKRSSDARSLMSGVASDTLGLKSKDDVHSKLGIPGGPPEKFKPWHSSGGIKRGMQKKNKRGFIM
ncbi:hypothetical protein M407DRAFT_18356 [Tulasnella calospora MUT 4182]|uniref:Ubiquitin carboxyl-terminal hydrolase n=1 Tax=Tulasnella calospora MUT 4182 TaxID=1051891 RepID=A0A0C3MGT2_9AGAM|nr:hypothetical protein M407DRAFT_18356 [Tulasnella calospora MUT 4182]